MKGHEKTENDDRALFVSEDEIRCMEEAIENLEKVREKLEKLSRE